MSIPKKKTAKKKTGPGRGGKRAGAGRKPMEGARRALLSVKLTEDAKARVESVAKSREISTGELVQEWAESL